MKKKTETNWKRVTAAVMLLAVSPDSMSWMIIIYINFTLLFICILFIYDILLLYNIL